MLAKLTIIRYLQGEWLTNIKFDNSVVSHQRVPERFDGRTEGFHFFRLSQLLSHKITVHQSFIVHRHGYEEGILDSTIHKSIYDYAEYATLGHAGFSRSSTSTLDEELEVVSGSQAFHNVGVKSCSIENVFASGYRVHTSFYVKGTETTHKPAENQNISI